MDLSRCAANKMLAEICKAAGINIEEVAAVFAGPPCETYSPADACNISRGNEYRNHADVNKGPREWSTVHCEADKLKRERAILHDNMIKNLIQSIVEERKHNDFEIVLENPVGSLRKRPFMQTEEWKELTDLKNSGLLRVRSRGEEKHQHMDHNARLDTQREDRQWQMQVLRTHRRKAACKGHCR